MVLELAMPLVTTGYGNVASGVISQSLGELMVSLLVLCKYLTARGGERGRNRGEAQL